MPCIKKLLVAAVLLPIALTAQAGQKDVKEFAAPETKLAISGDFGVEVVSEYITRGVPQETRGVIAQPYLDLSFALYEGNAEDFINKVSLDLGLWSSLHSRATAAAAGSTTPDWYEFDYSVGLSVTFLKNFTLAASYLELDSPSDAFPVSRNLNFTLSFDDSDILGPFALKPHVSFLHEMTGKAAADWAYIDDGGEILYRGHHGNYYEVGVTPSLPTIGIVELSLPVNVGFGSRDFYPANKGFGFFSVGVVAEVPLTFIPAKFGAWKFNAGATYYRIPKSLARNWYDNIDSDRVVFSGGIGASF